MNKAKGIGFIIIALVLSYAVITLFMPVLTDVVTSTDAELLIVTANITADYPGAKEAMDWTPWALYLIPGFIGVISAVIVLRQP